MGEEDECILPIQTLLFLNDYCGRVEMATGVSDSNFLLPNNLGVPTDQM